MDLFPDEPLANCLPGDGVVHYHGSILSPEEVEHFLTALTTSVPWRHDEVVLFGKRIVTGRKVAWYGDQPYSYTYSGTTRTALPWLPELLDLRNRVHQHLEATLDACLLNHYADGSQGMSWHSDDEKELRPGAPIASLSLGAARPFRFKHKRDPDRKVSLVLEPGSLLVMMGQTQENWLHALPKTKRVSEPRINLTFRSMAEAPS